MGDKFVSCKCRFFQLVGKNLRFDKIKTNVGRIIKILGKFC